MSQHENFPQHSDGHIDVTVETLRTPPLHIPPAPISKRLVAGLIDSLMVAFVWLLVAYLLGQGVRQHPYVGAVYLALVTFGYYFLQEWWLSLTLGKRLLGLRVVGSEGDPLSIRESLIRNLIRFIDWLPALYILGGIMMYSSKGRRRLGDVAAGTVVTRSLEKDSNPPPAPFLFH